MRSKTKQLAELIKRRAGNTIFSCEFVKRSTGKTRLMLCRLKVPPKEPSREERPYEPEDHDLLTVYDVQKKAYRQIPLDGILRLKIRGEVFVTEPEE